MIGAAARLTCLVFALPAESRERAQFLFAASFNPSRSKIIAICGGT
jgi:hypothetical protein